MGEFDDGAIGTENDILDNAKEVFNEGIDPQSDGAAGADDGAQQEEFDSAFLDRAKSYGFAKDDLSGVPREKIERMFTAADRLFINNGGQRHGGQQNGQQYGQNGQQNGQGQGQQQQGQSGQQAITGYKPFEFKLDPEAVGEDVAKTFKDYDAHVNNHVNAALGSLNQQLQEAVNTIHGMNAEARVSVMDNFFSSLGDEWAAELGKGATLDLDENSKEFTLRAEISTSANALREAYGQRGQRLPETELYRRAFGAVMQDKIAEKERTKVKGKLAERSKQHTERPSRQQQAPISKLDRAKRVFNEGKNKIRS